MMAGSSHKVDSCNQRYFPNPYKDLDEEETPSVVNKAHNGVTEPFKDKIYKNVHSWLSRLECLLVNDRCSSDSSVYTGSAGIALLYIHLATKLHQPKFMRAGLPYVKNALTSKHGRHFSFLCGDTGPLAVAAAIYHYIGETDKVVHCLGCIAAYHPTVLNLSVDMADELMTGRAGYLFTLLFLKKHLGESAVDDVVVKQVIEAILESGQRLVRYEQHKNTPIMYKWHNKNYLGAAHGLAGILHVLLMAEPYLTKEQKDHFIRPALNMLAECRFPSPSGNFQSSLGSTSDRLVHWCHGSPGVIHVYSRAYQVFGDPNYLMLAQEAAEVVWERGILKKGYCICHGVAGNAYAFLEMYQLTQDLKYLHRACKFAEWCFSYGTHCSQCPDRPLSLFEGLAGLVYFLADMLEPAEAKFPAFKL